MAALLCEWIDRMLSSPRSPEAVAAFIEKMHIFHNIKEEHLFQIADYLEDRVFRAGQVILDSEQPSENFYIIYDGQVSLNYTDKGQQHLTLVPGDYCGADVFFPGKKKRNAKMTAKSDVLLLTLPSSVFGQIPEAVDFLRKQIEPFLSARKLLIKNNFSWVDENETVYFATRKHIILFWRRLPLSLILSLVAVAATCLSLWHGLMSLLILSLGLFAVS